VESSAVEYDELSRSYLADQIWFPIGIDISHLLFREQVKVVSYLELVWYYITGTTVTAQTRPGPSKMFPAGANFPPIRSSNVTPE
jgi:hypothetical protein